VKIPHDLSYINSDKRTAHCSKCGANSCIVYKQVKPTRKCPDGRKWFCATGLFAPKPQRLKFRNIITPTVEANGRVIHHHSGKEARRWKELQLLEKAEEIRSLERQVPFHLVVNGVLICTYYADFTYSVRGRRKKVVEDAKGKLTDVYKLKKKLMKAIHNVEVIET